MSFSYSSGVITQTGTETGNDQLAGLSGLTGVTTTTLGERTVYSINSSTRIIFDGTCVIDPRYCELETNRLGGSGIVVNGTLDLGKELTYTYGTQYTSGRALNILGGSNAPWTAIFDVHGTLNWYGCEVETGSSIQVKNGGTIKIRDGVFISRLGNHTIQQGNTIIFDAGSTSDIIGLKKTLTGSLTADNSAVNILGAFTTVNLSGVVSTGGIAPDNRSTTLAPVPFATVSNFERLQRRIAECRTVLAHFDDCASWDTSLAMFLGLRSAYGTVTRYGQAEFYRNCNGKILFNGSGLQGVKLYWKDIDNGNRGVTTATEWGQTYNSYREYTATTDANGDFTSRVLEAAFYNTNPSAGAGVSPPVDDRTESGHKITFKGYKYGYSLSDIQFQGNRIVAAEATQPVIADANITESNKATVDAYTEIDTAAKFYDRAASHLEDNFGTYLDFIVTRSGNQIELTNKTLVIDTTASAVFDYSDPQITIKASTYTGGATVTTGSVTTLNGALLSGGTFDCDVNYQSGAGTSITGVTVNGVLDFNTAGTYTLDGCTISEVTNSSGGAITLSLTNGSTVTTNTGPNITLEQSVNITAPNIIDGSRVQIYNVTKSAEIDNSVVSGGSGYSTSVNLLSASVDDGDTIRLRATYTSGTSAKSEALATGIIGITGLSFLTTQDDDTAYNTLALDGSTITKFTADYVNDEIDISVASDFTLAEFYAWWVYNLTTSQGVAEFFGGVTAVDEANFKINNTVVNIYLDNATATNISQTDNRRLYRADGARPVVSSTSGGGGIDVEWRSPVTIAASETIQTNLTSILADTDELQQNQGDWLTATGFSTFNHATDQVIVATNNDKTGYSISGTKTTIDDLNDPTVQNIVDGVWDEVLTGATHNDPTSAGRRLRQASAWLSAEGNLTGTPTTSTLPTDLTETTTSFYADQTMVIVSGSQAGQARIITNYDGTTKIITVEEPFTSAPSAGDEFAIFANHVHALSQIQEGLDTLTNVKPSIGI